MNKEQALTVSKQRVEAFNGILEEYERLVAFVGERGIFRPGALEPSYSVGENTVITFSLWADIYTPIPPCRPGPEA
jgi:hypothetical protein